MTRPTTIGCISQHLSGHYNGIVISAVAEEAARQSVALLVFQGQPSELAAMDLARDQVDGWVCLPPLDQAGLAELAAWGRPLVVMHELLPANLNGTSILSDNRNSIYGVVQHLIEHGHTRIGFVGYFALADFRERYQYYLDALATFGLPADPQLCVTSGGFEPSHAEQAIREFFAAGGRCTALVAASDEQALGALQGLEACGLRVPEDVALIGFDDIAEARYATPLHQRPVCCSDPQSMSMMSGRGLSPPAMESLRANAVRPYAAISVSGRIAYAHRANHCRVPGSRFSVLPLTTAHAPRCGSGGRTHPAPRASWHR